MKEKQHGSFYGLGIQIQKRMGKITVIAPMEGTPAYKMGIRAGRRHHAHRRRGAQGRRSTTEEVVRKLRGPKGTDVTITIRRVGFDEPIQMTITRAEIPTKSVRYAFMLEPGVGYIMLSDFTHTSSRELYEAIEKLEKQGMKKLAASTCAATRAASSSRPSTSSDVFVPKGSMVIYTRGRTASSAQEYFAPGEGAHFDQPLVVLVNRGSASASEIVAGAIQDHDRGVIVGQRTWGKGLVQSVYTLSYGAGLALTTARYYTPSGRWIQRDYSDLLAYVNPGDPDASAEKGEDAPHPSAESAVFYTDAGRVVYAQGGITPDVDRQERPGLEAPPAAPGALRVLQLRGRLALPPPRRSPRASRSRPRSGTSSSSSSRSPPSTRPPKTSRRPTTRTSTAASSTSPSRSRSSTPASGREAGRRAYAAGDPQIQKGLTLFGEAARIAALPKKKRDLAVKAGGQ